MRDDDKKVRRMLNEEQLLDRIPISPTTLRRLIAKGRFPAPIALSPYRNVWYEDVIFDFIRELERNPRQLRSKWKKKRRPDAPTDPPTTTENE